MTVSRPPILDLHDAADRESAQRHLASTSHLLKILADSGDPLALLLRQGGSRDAYRVHEIIRSRGPVTMSETGISAITSYDLCDQVLRDSRFGVRYADGRLIFHDPVTEAASGPMADSLLDLDPPEHTRVRRLLAPAFRPKLVRGYEDRLQRIADHIVDQLDPQLGFDLIKDFAAPFTINVISELLGIPDVDTERFRQIGLLVGQSLGGVPSLSQADRLLTYNQELGDLFRRLSERPSSYSVQSDGVVEDHDVFGLLRRMMADGRLSQEELVTSSGMLLVAGFETTVNLVGNGVAALLNNRNAWERLAKEYEIASRVVNETLRYDPPVQYTLRVAHEPVDLAGTSLAPERIVLVDIAAANRDPDVFAKPSVFDVDRPDSREPLAFASGVHYCLGAGLARLEGEVAFRTIARRLPTLQTAGRRRRRSGSIIRGFEHYPVRTG